MLKKSTEIYMAVQVFLTSYLQLFYELHVASPAGDRPSVYRIYASMIPTRWQYVYQQLITE